MPINKRYQNMYDARKYICYALSTKFYCIKDIYYDIQNILLLHVLANRY